MAAPPGSAPPSKVETSLRSSRSCIGYLCRCGAPPPTTRTDRSVFINNPEANAAEFFINNTVITSRYTLLSFIPVFLFQQFTRFANAYFLIVS